jgi:N-acetylglucosamine-6-phosphate deacetylase
MITNGLFDLHVNGYAGVDFNDPGIDAVRLDHALEAMLAAGVTGCLPTLITTGPDELQARLRALDAAVAGSRYGAAMVPGYHLEGPFLNPAAGYAGCHPPAMMCDPDTGLVGRLEQGLSRPVLLITIAPERTGAMHFICEMVRRGKAMAMAHSAANLTTVRQAADAGMSLSTHLGNGLPRELPKLENVLLAQLAEPRLSACLIADGHHMSPEALTALIAIKGTGNSILVTDAVLAAAASAGRYCFAGIGVERRSDGAVIRPGHGDLAGSSLCLDQAVRNVCRWGIATPPKAVGMASANARRALARPLAHYGIELDPGRIAWNSALEPRVEKLSTPYGSPKSPHRRRGRGG